MTEPIRRPPFARKPAACPECGGSNMEPATVEDLGPTPLDPEDAPPLMPGMMQCRRCGAITQWGP